MPDALTDAASRRQTYERHVLPEVSVLLRVARSMTSQPADAEDLVQDTLLRAWRSLDSFDGQHARAWLLTILRNANINAHRRRRPVLLDDPDAPSETASAAGPGSNSAEDTVLVNTFDDVVESAVQNLAPSFREVLLLVDVDGLTYAETAAALGIPEGTVMSRLHRARKRVRDRLTAAGLAGGSKR